MSARSIVALWAASFLLGCGARSQLSTLQPCSEPDAKRPCQTICGDGTERCVAGYWQLCSAPRPKADVPLAGRVRDFHASHPNFEATIADDHGIVQPLLGADDKPVYDGNPTTPTTSGKANFDQWFRDVDGVNQASELTIWLRAVEGASPPLYRYDNQAFFPVDDQFFGNEGNPHNFHFTFEVHTSFRYLKGESFSFRGDDDLWVFINRRLAIDLGGVHNAQGAVVDLDAQAASLGLEPGGIYDIALFFAERHTSASTFRIDTTMTELEACP